MNTNSPNPPIETKIAQTETLIRELARILLPQSSPIKTVWEAANQVCDRYHLHSAA